MADVDNQESVHQEGVEHIKKNVADNEGAQGTATSAPTTKPEPITPAKPPASNPGADDPTAGIAKDAGGVSSSAHVEPPVAASNQKRKSIVGQLKGLFLGGDKKEREVSEAGTAKQGGTTTGAVAAGAAGTGVAATTATSPAGAGATGADTAASGPALNLPDRTKSGDNTFLNYSDGQKTTTEQAKEAVTGDKDANTGAATASTTGGPATDTTAPGTEPGSTADKVENGPKDTSGEDSHKPPAAAGGKPTENREAIPTAGGKKLGEEHWGESKIVPDNPKPADAGVSSGEGQPTSEVKDNTAKNTGGATGGPHDSNAKDTPEKKGKFMDKVKDKLPFGKKD